jgi:hypothetical protein
MRRPGGDAFSKHDGQRRGSVLMGSTRKSGGVSLPASALEGALGRLFDRGLVIATRYAPRRLGLEPEDAVQDATLSILAQEGKRYLSGELNDSQLAVAFLARVRTCASKAGKKRREELRRQRELPDRWRTPRTGMLLDEMLDRIRESNRVVDVVIAHKMSEGLEPRRIAAEYGWQPNVIYNATKRIRRALGSPEEWVP